VGGDSTITTIPKRYKEESRNTTEKPRRDTERERVCERERRERREEKRREEERNYREKYSDTSEKEESDNDDSRRGLVYNQRDRFSFWAPNRDSLTDFKCEAENQKATATS
jgi:hypothetical protein